MDSGDRLSLPSACEFCGTPHQVTNAVLDGRWTAMCRRCFDASGLGDSRYSQLGGRPHTFNTTKRRKGFGYDYPNVVYEGKRNPVPYRRNSDEDLRSTELNFRKGDATPDDLAVQYLRSGMNREEASEALRTMGIDVGESHETLARVTGVPLRRWTLITYDVWGNEADGWDVNDAYRTREIISLPTDASDDEILQLLEWSVGLLLDAGGPDPAEILRLDSGGPSIYFQRQNSGRPMGELELIEEDVPGLRRNPLNLIMNVSKLTLRLEKFSQVLRDGLADPFIASIVQKLIDRTAALPAVPSPQVFGMYLENFMTIFSAGDTYPATRGSPILVLEELAQFHLNNFGFKHSRLPELLQLEKEIHEILRSTTLYYIEKHRPNRTVVDRSVKQFLDICGRVLAAAYATPSLSSPYFNECLAGLDKFCWKLRRIDLSNLTVPRWAALKDGCDLPDDSIFRTAALEVGLVVSGYAGSVLPQFAGIRSTAGGEIGQALDTIRNELDIFKNDAPWATYALLLHKGSHYFMWEGHL